MYSIKIPSLVNILPIVHWVSVSVKVKNKYWIVKHDHYLNYDSIRCNDCLQKNIMVKCKRTITTVRNVLGLQGCQM